MTYPQSPAYDAIVHQATRPSPGSQIKAIQALINAIDFDDGDGTASFQDQSHTLLPLILTLPPMNTATAPFLDTAEDDEISKGGDTVRRNPGLSSFQLLALFAARLSRIQRPISMQSAGREGLGALAGVVGNGERSTSQLIHNTIGRFDSAAPIPHLPIRLFEDLTFKNVDLGIQEWVVAAWSTIMLQWVTMGRIIVKKRS
ncbi:hypothetical protein R3P38DRAFT_2814059 [Favolaschia claudopus]